MSDINFGAITEALNDKADRDLNNMTANIDYVVESYNDGTNWYRVYKSGWVEQGAKFPTNSTNIESITFLKPFAELPTLQICAVTTNATFQNGNVNAWNLSETGFTKQCQANVITGWSYYACGQGA